MEVKLLLLAILVLCGTYLGVCILDDHDGMNKEKEERYFDENNNRWKS